jgi:hypothetical protein
VLEGVPGTTFQRLLGVEFLGDEVRPPETIWEGEVDFFGGPGRPRVVGGRYVITPRGGVIDVWAKEVVQSPGHELLDIVGGRVVTRVGSSRCPNDVLALDLRTQAVEPLAGADRERYEMPGVRSTDGKKSVETVGSEIIVHRPGHPPRPVGSFSVQTCPVSGRPEKLPVLWLDEEQFLTQDGNGHLVRVSLDGVRTPVATVPVRTAAGATHLARHLDGRIIYECGAEAFVIHPTAGIWERPEWLALGYGFEASWEENEFSERTVRHRGRTIGQCPCWPGGTASAEGFLAVAVSTHGATSGWDAVRVWSAKTGTWSTVAVRPAALVGWAR